MRTFIGALVLSLLLVAPALGDEYAPEAKGVLEHTVSVEIPGGTPGTWIISGTGVAIARDGIEGSEELGILTAKHIASDLPKSAMIRACSSLVPSRCISLHEYKPGPGPGTAGDWKVYLVDHLPKDVKPVRRHDDDPKVGARVQQVGYPHSNLIYSRGLLSGKSWGSSQGILVVTGLGLRGSSGGPVFSNDGALLGIVSGIPLASIPGYEPMQQAVTNVTLVVPVTERMFN